MAGREAIVRWLLAGDPAIRWQAMRDLAGAPAADVATERARVATEGWGAAILGLQQPNGQFGAGEDPGWMQTIRTLTLLKDLGAMPDAPPVRAAIERVKPLRFEWHDNRAFFEGESEACLNGRILGIAAYFGVPSERLLRQLIGEQLADGGWNCDAPPSTRSSIHSTICVLEGLIGWERAIGVVPEARAARLDGEAYLLERGLMRGRRSGEIIDRRILRVGSPPGWEYDVLRALDYFRSAGAAPDPRMAEAVDIVRRRAHQNGRWPLNRIGADPGVFLPETEVGGPSRWNTLRALRVLDWYEGGEARATPSARQATMVH
jgi:hypothetical protein